jgi:hypothetical protein
MKNQILSYAVLLSMTSLLLLLSRNAYPAQESGYTVNSPDRNIVVSFRLTEKKEPVYQIVFANTQILQPSLLGVIRRDGDFSKDMSLESVSDVEAVRDDYQMLQGKKKHCSYRANRRIFHLSNADGEKMDVIFQVSDDGVAFRYRFPEKSDSLKKIVKETSSFHFLPGTKAFIQPMSAAKSGWSQVNPCYEEFYTQGVAIDKLPVHEPGWVFPALFQSGEFWVLLSETAPERNYCGCRLQQEPGSQSLFIDFPQKPEVVFGGALYPESTLPWDTPWRIIAIGKGLGAIVESTLGTDLAEPAREEKMSFVKPGKASWSWVLLKDDSTIYSVQKKFIDFASEMTWDYCLIDADWDIKIGYDKIAELAGYAKTKGVGLILWYNSAGDWNTAPYHPRSKLLTHEDRVKEFSRLKQMGIKGIKVDFFGGDGQSVIDYYQDIIEDAYDFGLMVNCHGATIPRGWQRTYPNLVTMEAVRGFEYVTFSQDDANNEPNHACMLPFTRNVFDPMDFTPVCFSEVPRIRRVTSDGFELALSVIFLSGIQHYAERPEGMARVPDYVQDFMRKVPNTWDESRFVDGFPGKLVVIARRSAGTWYVAGINGEDAEKTVSLDFSFLQKNMNGILISDGVDNRSFAEQKITAYPKRAMEIGLKGYSGFVIKLEE